MKNLPVLALGLALAAAMPAAAQPAPPTGETATAPAATSRQHTLFRGSRIIGSNVRDPKDRKIGQIKDLILDGGRGEIAYAVVSFGGVLGVGRKYHAVPWRVLEPDDSGRFYILHADRETISLAPGFDKARWPDMADRKWGEEIERYWSRTVGSRSPSEQRLSSGAAGAPGAKAPAAPEQSGR